MGVGRPGQACLGPWGIGFNPYPIDLSTVTAEYHVSQFQTFSFKNLKITFLIIQLLFCYLNYLIVDKIGVHAFSFNVNILSNIFYYVYKDIDNIIPPHTLGDAYYQIKNFHFKTS